MMRKTLFTLLCFMLLFFVNPSYSAPAKAYWNRWVGFDPLSQQVIEYPVWRAFLQQYVVIAKQQTTVDYRAVTPADKAKLKQAIQRLSTLPLANYNRHQQLAYWINLYNMETVYIILKHYPVNSILDIKSGLLDPGPWNKKTLIVDGQTLTLNDIEHRILRPLWHDPRIHAAVNCASMSCPNLLATPFTGKMINTQLNNAFRTFVNSSKGVIIRNNTIELSKIFDWYGLDFGNNFQDTLHFISLYRKLPITNNISFQHYDWQLNRS